MTATSYFSDDSRTRPARRWPDCVVTVTVRASPGTCAFVTMSVDRTKKPLPRLVFGLDADDARHHALDDVFERHGRRLWQIIRAKRPAAGASSCGCSGGSNTSDAVVVTSVAGATVRFVSGCAATMRFRGGGVGRWSDTTGRRRPR